MNKYIKEEKAFDFIPYYYGCFSFQANQDIMTLAKLGYLSIIKSENGRRIQICQSGNYLMMLDMFEQQAIKEIKEKLHLPVPEFYYIPAGMEYSKYMVFEDTQIAWIEYQYNEHIVYFQLAANENDLSQGSWKDKEKVQVDTLDEAIEVEVGTISENDEENYYALWKYKDAYYQLSGQIEKEELIKILNEMQYNV